MNDIIAYLLKVSAGTILYAAVEEFTCSEEDKQSWREFYDYLINNEALLRKYSYEQYTLVGWYSVR